MFAPRLRCGDRVVYITKRGKYVGRESDWRLTAMLRVTARFENHADAARWYAQQGLPAPRNLMVAGNDPLPFDHTDGQLGENLRARAARMTSEQIVRVWDAGYAARARDHGVVLACEPMFRDLTQPPAINEEDWEAWYGRVPATRTPPEIPEGLWAHLWNRARRSG